MMYKKSILTVLIIISCVLFLTLCKKEPTEPSELMPVTVGEGLKPIYSWTGGPVNIIEVRYEGVAPVFLYLPAGNPGIGITDEGVVWGAKMQYSEDAIATPVTHGIRPAGANKWGGNVTTLPAGEGKPFIIRVIKTNGVIGQKVFSR